MGDLARRIGLGLAARGDVDDVITWAERARDAGLESTWFHDSYFERDAVTYASAVAARVSDIRIGLGALNPFTRHPVLIAMTVSALDEMAPRRIILALGSALPLRLAQMNIPYTPDEGARRVSEAIDVVRQLWKGERLPAAKPGLPPLQPMFAPVHRVPIFVAGYRTPMMQLAGEKADGYIARPAESIAGFTTLVRLLQPVVQDETQVERLVQAALIYGEAKVARARASADGATSAGTRVLRRAAAWAEIIRPFALTASS